MNIIYEIRGTYIYYPPKNNAEYNSAINFHLIKGKAHERKQQRQKLLKGAEGNDWGK